MHLIIKNALLWDQKVLNWRDLEIIKGAGVVLRPTTAQCCVFNNFSMVKHWHQFWHWIVISVFCFGITNWPWILPQFTSLFRKLALVFLFRWIWVFWKKNFFQPSFTKKITFYIQTKSFWVRIVIPKFQELHFCFSDLFPNHEFS